MIDPDSEKKHKIAIMSSLISHNTQDTHSNITTNEQQIHLENTSSYLHSAFTVSADETTVQIFTEELNEFTLRKKKKKCKNSILRSAMACDLGSSLKGIVHPKVKIIP